MKTTIIYVALLAILGFGVWFFLFNRTDSFSLTEAGFSVTDTAAISKIFLAGKNGITTRLERDSVIGWKLNGTYPAFVPRVNLLLRTLHDQQAQFPVPEAQHNNVVRSLIANAIKVEIYGRDGHKISVFFVGGEADKFTGTYMLKEGAERPYAVQVANFDGYLTPRYEPGLTEWRDRTVFSIAPERLRQVSVRYMQEPLNSFTFNQAADGKITVALDSGIAAGQALNERRAHAYTKFFTNLNNEGFANGVPGLDTSISHLPRFCTLDISGDKGYHEHLDVYYFPQTRRSKNLAAPRTDFASNYDPDRYYAVTNNGRDTITIQTQMVEKIFRRGYEFFMADKQQ